ADAVAQAVGEIVAIARLCDDFAGDSVTLYPADACSQPPLRLKVSPQHDVIYLAELVGRFAQANSARHVRVVALEARAHINHDRLTLLDRPIAGHRVSHSAVRASGYNRAESPVVRA